MPRATNPRQSHDLKCWPTSYRAILTGRCRFTVRRDDRPYRSGDQVTLHEYDPSDEESGEARGRRRGGFTGQKATYLIGYVSRSAAIPSGWCAFELVSLEDANRASLAILGPEAVGESERRPAGPGLGLRR